MTADSKRAVIAAYPVWWRKVAQSCHLTPRGARQRGENIAFLSMILIRSFFIILIIMRLNKPLK
jgi:hypothetical protein